MMNEENHSLDIYLTINCKARKRYVSRGGNNEPITWSHKAALKEKRRKMLEEAEEITGGRINADRWLKKILMKGSF